MDCKTEVNRLCRIDRGYEYLDDKLAANVERVRGGCVFNEPNEGG